MFRYCKLISRYVFKGLHKVMLLAPIGAFGGMAYTISKYGIERLYPLAKVDGNRIRHHGCFYIWRSVSYSSYV